MLKLYGFTVLLVLTSLFASAQLTVDLAGQNSNPNFLVNEILVSGGVDISNVSFSGDADQIGFFSDGSNQIGLDSGIIIATGTATLVEGPNTSGSFNLGGGNMGVSDPDLDAIVGNAGTNDAAVLEFDFVPSSDTVRFRYVFGSEEYLEWVNAGFNDVFGFFISGPGFNGPYSNNAENIARVPGTNTVVSIDNVNNNSNNAFFVNNTGGAVNLQLDGFTTVLTAQAVVQCGELYHLKLAIADAGDDLYDSGVFLEAKSFGSRSIEFSATPTYTSNLGDTIIFEGCGEVSLGIIRDGDLNYTDTVYLKIDGTAIEGEDYSPVSDTLIFTPGLDSINLSFIPIFDSINENMETIIISVLESTSACNTNNDTIVLFLNDLPPINLSSTGDTFTCFMPNAYIITEVTQGLPPYTYSWSTGVLSTDSVSPIDSLSVSPLNTTTYYVTVEDGCGVSEAVDTVEVVIPSYDFNLQSFDDTLTCFFDSIEIGIEILNPVNGNTYDFTWSTGDHLSTTSVTDSIYVNPPLTTHYYVTVTESCDGISKIDTLEIFVPYYNVELYMQDSSVLCRGDSIILDTLVTGGYFPYSLWWENNLTNGIGNALLIDSTSTYTFYTTDQCAKDTDIVVITITAPQKLILDSISDIPVYCPETPVNVTAMASGGTGTYYFSWDNWITEDANLFVAPDSTETFTVEMTDDCEDTLIESFTVLVPQYPPILIDPIDSVIGCIGESETVEVKVIGGTGVYTYSWGNSYSTANEITVHLDQDNTTYSVTVTDECENTNSVKIPTKVKHPKADFNPVYFDVSMVEFRNLSSNDAIDFNWAFGDGFQSSNYEPTHSYTKEGAYVILLTVWNEYRCSDQIAKTIQSPNIIYIPNVFTPNGDALNEVWKPIHNGLKNYSLIVVNRWGDSIFTTNDPNQGWDGNLNGKPAEMGVYQYILIGQSSVNGEDISTKGSFLLLR